MSMDRRQCGAPIALASPIAAIIGAAIWGYVVEIFSLDRLIYAGIYFGMAYFSWAYIAGGSNPTFSDFIGSLKSIFNSTGLDAQQQPEQARVKCPKCGGEMDPGAAFCTHCGSERVH